jgi:hypothetical protein
MLSMGTMKRGFKKLRHIWELLIVEDWPFWKFTIAGSGSKS